MGHGVTVHFFDIGGTRLVVDDSEGSNAAEWIAGELLVDDYALDRIPFEAGDVVLDIGAHVGIFAIHLALRHPDIIIIAAEPDLGNFRHLAANIARNDCANIVALNLAVTAAGGPFPIARPPDNSGGASGFYSETEGFSCGVADSISIDQLFARYVPDRCKLLKIDCEGAEHEILPACTNLSRVDWFSAEFHINDKLRGRGFCSEGLAEHVAQFVPRERMALRCIVMGE